jgi:hypothetical protein
MRWRGDKSQSIGLILRWRSRHVWTIRHPTSISAQARCTLFQHHRSAKMRQVTARTILAKRQSTPVLRRVGYCRSNRSNRTKRTNGWFSSPDRSTILASGSSLRWRWMVGELSGDSRMCSRDGPRSASAGTRFAMSVCGTRCWTGSRRTRSSLQSRRCGGPGDRVAWGHDQCEENPEGSAAAGRAGRSAGAPEPKNSPISWPSRSQPCHTASRDSGYPPSTSRAFWPIHYGSAARRSSEGHRSVLPVVAATGLSVLGG